MGHYQILRNGQRVDVLSEKPLVKVKSQKSDDALQYELLKAIKLGLNGLDLPRCNAVECMENLRTYTVNFNDLDVGYVENGHANIIGRIDMEKIKEKLLHVALGPPYARTLLFQRFIRHVQSSTTKITTSHVFVRIVFIGDCDKIRKSINRARKKTGIKMVFSYGQLFGSENEIYLTFASNEDFMLFRMTLDATVGSTDAKQVSEILPVLSGFSKTFDQRLTDLKLV